MRRSRQSLPQTLETYRHIFETGAGPVEKKNPRDDFRNDVFSGLRARPKRLSSVYFYDDAGSALFERITRLPEYYLTRVEQEILEKHADSILETVLGEPCCIVDLGAGDGVKTQILLERIHARGGDVRYAPVDVSAAALWSAERRMREHLPWLQVDAVLGEYAPGLARIRKAQTDRRLLVLWLGSSIGNFVHDQAVAMLRGLASACAATDTLLVGFDLLKDPKRLVAAYDDAEGVTAELNYNLLTRINRELGGDFDRKAFVHHAAFSPDRARMESYLVSTRKQVVHVAGRAFELAAWEPIHTEVSCKYSDAEISSLLQAAGLARVQAFTDAEQLFVDVACRPACKPSKPSVASPERVG